MGHPIKTCDYCGREGKMPTFMTGETACMNCTKKRVELMDPRKVMALSKENEQLKAQVNELLDQLQYIASQYSNCGCGHPACRRCQDQRENDEIIARIEKGLK